MTALFVTATGTDIGKTFVACGLIRALRRAGRAVAAIKPVVSGFDPAHPEASDTGALLAALDRPLTSADIDGVSPWRFRAPLSPDMAAAREGKSIDVDAVIAHSRDAVANATDVLIIEGIGGVMVPLDQRRTVLDWIAFSGAPVLLVTGSYLGTLSHTLTALAVLAQRQVAVAGIIVSESEAATVPLDETLATLRRIAGAGPVLAVRREAASPDFDRLAADLRL